MGQYWSRSIARKVLVLLLADGVALIGAVAGPGSGTGPGCESGVIYVTVIPQPSVTCGDPFEIGITDPCSH